ncbi:fimbrial protein [Salmonella enterica subsp. enterica serovar Stanleyville]|uniref:Fimbrial protein n=1 Tax=Salmonella enterica I TaxID=59201 RepID=A0A3V2IL39_SALET|nr:fimbrial-like protein [Salmonella enterica]AZT34366.1 fimbrial protein [Salmonella enterica subsp. enterica serovar Stanleyville]EBQ9028631.1 fimbrial protein [Salmonella enterica subsp. enterica serovar Ajiobo]EKF5618569.1 fimbrial protein [Salmonella enterica subsp. enterica]AZT65404.1 fimbrial protein [Salmonella enterica subsp. enterica serovar Stanleyville]AZT69582.1 fimbrial protein [Salmonella enterica subsp. enterica serovar Stanleyville]
MSKLLCAIVALGSSLVAPLSQADTDVEIRANVVNTSCEISIDNNGLVDLGTKGYDYFASGITAEDLYQGGSTFYVHVKDCMPVSGKDPSKLIIHFSPLSGSFAVGSAQIFANDQSDGAKNVGVVIFSTQDANNVYNVMNTDGTPRSQYDVTAADYADSRYSFYARMQKVQSGQSIVSGAVKSSVLVSVYYE